VTPPVKVRLYEPDDLDRILDIEQTSFAEDAWEAKLFQRYFRQCGELFLVAKVGRRIGGYAITCAQSRNAELVSIAVDPRDRGRGVARLLLDYTAAQLRLKQTRAWWLMVEIGNESAIRFYEKYGFKLTKRVKGYYGRGRDAWRMKMVL
jgi:[ribosomal protein S18]-alanine N-acetyltransferase